MPEISVIMGVYNANRNNMIDLSVRSIIDQTYTDWELIICDDASTDGLKPNESVLGPLVS